MPLQASAALAQALTAIRQPQRQPAIRAKRTPLFKLRTVLLPSHCVFPQVVHHPDTAQNKTKCAEKDTVLLLQHQLKLVWSTIITSRASISCRKALRHTAPLVPRDPLAHACHMRACARARARVFWAARGLDLVGHISKAFALTHAGARGPLRFTA